MRRIVCRKDRISRRENATRNVSNSPAGSRGFHRAHPRTGDGKWQRDHAGLRRELCQPREDHHLAMGGGRGDGCRRWAHGPAAGTDWPKPRSQSAVELERLRADQAEGYGYINRALPDAELDSFVEALATRIARFDKWAIANTKRLVNTSLPPDVELGAGWDACIASLGRPAAQDGIKVVRTMMRASGNSAKIRIIASIPLRAGI